ncbi:sodium/proton antiporter (CPA1 family) [Thiogranum longum]|uniref:Sodium/proton antiporter (CPA1 family) n=1 Tax=Thiogranum longum TaxID=1537524 RepID=A0A4R1HN97_9GAMM|nr:sodium:proton antiporter [Thiogranum longum]TCK18732.1 sodium/proton antiporter (CPA1 family) [Thiogranum longum]
MNESIVLSIAAIGVLALACQWFAWWVKLPAILFLLLSGLLVGPVYGWINPDALFGDLLFPLVSLSVAVILFEGSLTLRFSEIKGLEHVVRRMVSSGMLVTWTVTTLATFTLLDTSFQMALLFGALTVVTGPTVIIPLLRTVRPVAHLANILRWEGIVIDPLGALLAVLVFEFIVLGSGGAAFGHTLLLFAEQILTGVVFGAAAGYALGVVLRRYWLPEFLHNAAALMVVFGVFALSNHMRAESGLLTVTVMGIWLANMKDVNVEGILDFKETLSIVLISGLFIILAARVDFNAVTALGWGALGVLLIMQFVARPLKILVSTWGSTLTWRERAMLAWVAPRGIVAAAVAALFALQLEQQGNEQASMLVPMTFIVIIGTVALQSVTARLVAVALGVAEPEPRGFLIVGGNPLARAIAVALQKQDIRVLLADTSWSNVRAAMMENIPAFYGMVVSEYADRRLDLVGIGQLLALSSVQEENALAVMRYRTEFGATNIYSLQVTPEKEGSAKTGKPLYGHIAFGEDVSYTQLSSMLSKGAEIHSTALTDEFGFNEYYKQHYGRAVPLFAINPRGKLFVYTADNNLKPTAGWTIISLIEPSPETDDPEKYNEPE